MTYDIDVIRLDVKLHVKTRIKNQSFGDLRDFERILTLNARVDW